MPSLREVIQNTHRVLEAGGIPDSRLEAEVMVMNVMRLPRQDLFSNQENDVAPQQERDLAAVCS